MAQPTFYVTTPIYYPNDKLHIGHTYTTVAADALARYHRLRGYKTMFLTGTDEHGQNIQRRAEQAGIEPKAYIDPIVDWIKELWRVLDISYDDFIRTTEPRHTTRVQQIFQQLYDQGDIYKGVYRGRYCANCEAFYTEDDLIDGTHCPIHEKPTEWVEEESYFFRLSKYGDRLLEHIKNHPEFVQPTSRRNEVIKFIERGLQDLSVSRTSFSWGIPVPFDEKHVIYVWIDALSNYITALGYPDGDAYRTFWPVDIHIIGKDILRFHAIIWPALLMALDLPLPKCVYGHGWLLIDGGKMGKSRAGGQVIDPFTLIEKYGLDSIRYFLLREVPFGADGTYSEQALIRRHNTDLANDLGNLVWRTTAMIERFCGGVVPQPQAGSDDTALQEVAGQVRARVEQAMARYDLHTAVATIWDLINAANKYIDDQAPWDLNKRGETARLHHVLYQAAEAARYAAALLTPFLVTTPERIYEQLGCDEDPRALGWDAGLSWGRLPAGVKVRRGEPLFPRIEDDDDKAPEQAAQPAQAGAAGGAGAAQAKPSEKPAAAATSPAITIDEFGKLDLRVVEIVAAERIPDTDKLLRVEVLLGDERRQVVAGIAQHYEPEALVGKQAVLVANLQPAVIRGVRSQGMLLAAGDGERLALIAPEQAMPSGSKVR